MPKPHRLNHQICKQDPGGPESLILTPGSPQPPQTLPTQKPLAHDGRKAMPSCPRLCWLLASQEGGTGCLPGTPWTGVHAGKGTIHGLQREAAGRQRDLGTDARWEDCHRHGRYVDYLF